MNRIFVMALVGGAILSAVSGCSGTDTDESAPYINEVSKFVASERQKNYLPLVEREITTGTDDGGYVCLYGDEKLPTRVMLSMGLSNRRRVDTEVFFDGKKAVYWHQCEWIDEHFGDDLPSEKDATMRLIGGSKKFAYLRNGKVVKIVASRPSSELAEEITPDYVLDDVKLIEYIRDNWKNDNVDIMAQITRADEKNDSKSNSSTQPASTGGSLLLEGGIYTIVEGDTLAGIARKVYGDFKYWDVICDANPKMHPASLRVGQVLNIPKLPANNSTTKPASRSSAVSKPVAGESEPFIFLGVAENETNQPGPGGSVNGQGCQIQRVSAVAERSWQEYQSALQSGKIFAQEEHGEYVYYAVKSSRDVRFDDASAIVEVIERFKTKKQE